MVQALTEVCGRSCLFLFYLRCAVLFYSHIVERMGDSSTGIKLTRNLEQGNRYKETFTGTPTAGSESPHIWRATLQREGSSCPALVVGSVVA